jgi:uncharacterized protein YndB with AHSA1/START domain
MASKKKDKMLPISKNKLGYTTSNVYRASLKKVWEAATQSKHLRKHFIDGGKGEFGSDLEPVTWHWKDWGDWTFQPLKYSKEKEIVFLGPDWDNTYLITIRFEFLKKNGKTIFRIHEHGYKKEHLDRAFAMCEGWTEFHSGIKMYLKWGADPRKL